MGFRDSMGGMLSSMSGMFGGETLLADLLVERLDLLFVLCEAGVFRRPPEHGCHLRETHYDESDNRGSPDTIPRSCELALTGDCIESCSG